MASSNEVFHWVSKDDIDGLPIHGITGAISSEGRRIYVIRALFWGKLVAGNYEEGMDQAELQYSGAQRSPEWEYLVSNESAAGMELYIFV